MDINRINRMTFQQLRDELSMSSDNPVKELLIRKLMKQRYLEYKNKQAQKIKKAHIEKKIKQASVVPIIPVERLIDDNVDVDETSIMMAEDLLNEIGKRRNDTQDIQEIMHDNSQEDNKSSEPIDEKFADEIERDQVNNYLMNRLNSDIHIQDMRANKRKTFETPFVDAPDERYASFHKDPSIIPNRDFTYNRMNNSKKGSK